MPAKTTTKATKAPKQLRFNVDCKIPVGDGYFDMGAFEQFLQSRIKVGGHALTSKAVKADAVVIQRQKGRIGIVAEPPFSKRYLKYLTKKFLKKNKLRDWLRVVAVNKTDYELRYPRINEEEEEAPAPAAAAN